MLTCPKPGEDSQKHKKIRSSEGLLIPDEASARQHWLHKGVDAPDLAMIKDFLRFYIATSRGKINADERPTSIRSTPLLSSSSPASPVPWVHRQMKKAGAKSTTCLSVGTWEIQPHNYWWVRITLTAEGLVVNIKRLWAVVRATVTAVGALSLPGRDSIPAITTELRLLQRTFFHFLDSSLLAKAFLSPCALFAVCAASSVNRKPGSNGLHTHSTKGE